MVFILLLFLLQLSILYHQRPKVFRVLVIRPSWVGLLTANCGLEYTPDPNFLEVNIS